MQGEGALLVGFRSDCGAELREFRVGFGWRGRIQKRMTGGQRSKTLGGEGVTGADRPCNLGVVQGHRGRARYLGVRHLVPEFKRVYGGKERERKKRCDGKIQQAGADCYFRWS